MQVDNGKQFGRCRREDIMKPRVAHYDASYHNFQSDLYTEIRREAFGEDIGQNSWHTSDEQDKFIGWLQLTPGKSLLDVACGAGGPALRVAEKTGCSVVGVDVHEQAITTANAVAMEQGKGKIAEFLVADAATSLPFLDGRFDAITCIDAINHLPDRERVITEWKRVLKPGGWLLFTDPTVVTGALTNAEIAVRSSIGFFLFVPADYDESVLAKCDLRVRVKEDVTDNMASIAERRRLAREKREPELRKMEGDSTYQGQQDFLEVAARIARDRRLSRFVYVSQKRN